MRKLSLALLVGGLLAVGGIGSASACCFFCCKKPYGPGVVYPGQPGVPGQPGAAGQGGFSQGTGAPDELREPVKPDLPPVPDPLPKLKAPPDKLPAGKK